MVVMKMVMMMMKKIYLPPDIEVDGKKNVAIVQANEYLMYQVTRICQSRDRLPTRPR